MRCDMGRCGGVHRDRCERRQRGRTIGCRNDEGTSRGVNQDWHFGLFPNVDVTESAVGERDRTDSQSKPEKAKRIAGNDPGAKV